MDSETVKIKAWFETNKDVRFGFRTLEGVMKTFVCVAAYYTENNSTYGSKGGVFNVRDEALDYPGFKSGIHTPPALYDILNKRCPGVNIYGVLQPDIYVSWLHAENFERYLVKLDQPKAIDPRYPKSCPTCKAPAYIGVVPTAIDCSSSACRYHRR